MNEDTVGMIALNVSVRIDAAAMREWKPERIAAFFAGIAAIQSAAGGETIDMEIPAASERIIASALASTAALVEEPA